MVPAFVVLAAGLALARDRGQAGLATLALAVLMATKIYLRTTKRGATGHTGVKNRVTDYTLGGALQNWRLQSTSKGSVSSGSSSNVPASGSAVTEFAAYVTGYNDASFTLSGTVTINVWAFESSMANNVILAAELFKVTPSGTVSSIGSAADAVELGTGAAAMNWTITPTSTVIEKGDRLMLILKMNANGTYGGGTITHYVGGPTDAATGDSWIQLTESSVTFTEEPTVAGTIFYFTETTSAESNGGEASATFAMSTSSTTAGSTHTTTNPADGSKFEHNDTDTVAWTTGPLQAATVGKLKVTSDLTQASSVDCEAWLRVVQVRGTSVIANLAQLSMNRTDGDPYRRIPIGASDWANCMVITDCTLLDGDSLVASIELDGSNAGSMPAATVQWVSGGAITLQADVTLTTYAPAEKVEHAEPPVLAAVGRAAHY